VDRSCRRCDTAAQDTALLTRLVGDLVAVLRSSGVETLTYGVATSAGLRAAQSATVELFGPYGTGTFTAADGLGHDVLHFEL